MKHFDRMSVSMLFYVKKNTNNKAHLCINVCVINLNGYLVLHLHIHILYVFCCRMHLKLQMVANLVI